MTGDLSMLNRNRNSQSLQLETLEQRQLLTTVPVLDNPVVELHAGDLSESAQFADSLSFSGSIAVIGAPGNDDNGRNSGSAYVFQRDDNGTLTNPHDDAWNQVAKLHSNDNTSRDRFGASVDIYGDDANGYTIIVGAPGANGAARDSGAAYVFQGAGSNWTQQAKLFAADGAKDDDFADSRSIAIHNETIVVGAERHDGAGSQSGAAYIFEADASGNWISSNQIKLLAADTQANDEFAKSVAIAGDTIVAGARGAQAVYVFERSAQGWNEQAKLTRADGGALGWDVTVSSAEDTIIASGEWEVVAFVKPMTGWVDKTDDAQIEPHEPVSEMDRFGGSLALSGNTLVVGAITAPNGGAAYVFDGSGSTWTPHAKLAQADGEGNFGVSVFTDGEMVFAGDPSDDAEPTGILDAGSMFVFSRDLTPGISVTPTTGLETTEGGGSDSFDVVLNSQPTSDVTISIASNAQTEGTANVSALTFTPTNWNLPQTVTVTGVNDQVVDGDTAYLIVTGPASSTDADYNGLDPEDVAVTNLDDDGAVASNLMYVWDVGFEQRGRKNTYRVVVDVRQDNDFDNTAESSDAGLAGVLVTVVFTDASGQTIHQFSGTTDSNGIFRSDWFNVADPGNYHAEATDLVLAGFVWDPDSLFDPTSNDDDFDFDGNPDELLEIA